MLQCRKLERKVTVRIYVSRELETVWRRASEFPHFKVKGDSGRILGASRVADVHQVVTFKDEK